MLDVVISDDDELEFDYPDERMMDGSDDEFSDMEAGSDDEDMDVFTKHPLSIKVLHLPPSSPSGPPKPPARSSALKPVTIEPFNSTVGPTSTISDSPVEVFDLFFTDDIVEETNRYAEQVMGQEK